MNYHIQLLEIQNKQLNQTLGQIDCFKSHFYYVPTFGISTGISSLSFIGQDNLESRVAPSVALYFNPSQLLGIKSKWHFDT